MQPTPPKSKKPQFRRPFYDAGKKTSAELISEARKSVKAIDAARPFTPAEPKRNLFGATTRPSEGRPPSAFSIGPNVFSETSSRVSSRPPTGKLSPLKSISDELVKGDSKDIGLQSSVTSQESSSSGYSDQYPNSIDQSQQVRRLSFPLPSKEPSVSKGQKQSMYNSIQTERRVQSGPKDRASSRSEDVSVIKKYSSMGNIQNRSSSAGKDDGNSSTVSVENNSVAKTNKARPSSTGNVLLKKENTQRNKSAENNPRNTSQVNHYDQDENRKMDVRRLSSSLSEGENDTQITLFKENVEPLLKQMELNYLHSDFAALGVNFDVLWKTLEICNLLGKGTGSGSARRRALVLRTVFKFVDADNAEVVLKLCKLALAMKVNGKNIVNICKLIFKISKDKTKDHLFKEEHIIYHLLELLKSSEIIHFFDGIVYATGSVKFLSVNPVLHEEFLKADCFQCFGVLLKRIIELMSGDINMLQLSHLIVQASAAIRNLADIPNTRSLIVQYELIESLLSLLNIYWKDADYMLIVSRILSKLSQYGDCCKILHNTSSSLSLLFEALKHYSKTKDIAVRLLFVFGNIAAKVEESRTDMYFEKSSLPVLLDILEEYTKKTLEAENILEHCQKYHPTNFACFVYQKNSLTGNIDENDDNVKDLEKSNEILVKTVRVIANLSIDPTVARNVANAQRFLHLIIDIMEKIKGKSSEELLINSAAALNNLSYYSDEETYLHSLSKEITIALIQLLFIDNMDCIIETTRVFGNFTRSKDIRTLLREKKVINMLITLLESNDREVVFCSCGVLINLMVDNENRKVLKDDKGIRKLIDALKDFGQTDWQLSSMICQTLCNYSEKITSSISCFGEEETEDLLQLLQDYLDPDIALDYSENASIDSETKELLKQTWTEQFEQVGFRLLNRIEDNHTAMEPLLNSPE